MKNCYASRGIDDRSLYLTTLHKYTYTDCMMFPGKEMGLTQVYFSNGQDKYNILGIWIAACGDVHYVIMSPNATVQLYFV